MFDFDLPAAIHREFAAYRVHGLPAAPDLPIERFGTGVSDWPPPPLRDPAAAPDDEAAAENLRQALRAKVLAARGQP